MNNTKFKLTEEVVLLSNDADRKTNQATMIIANLGKGFYLVAGYGPRVSEKELLKKYEATYGC